MDKLKFDTTDYIHGDTWNARIERERVAALDIESLRGDWQYAAPEPKVYCLECEDEVDEFCHRCWRNDLGGYDE